MHKSLIKPLAILPLVLLLGACDAVMNKVSEQVATNVDEASMREEFTGKCVDEAMAATSDQDEESRALFAQACPCT